MGLFQARFYMDKYHLSGKLYRASLPVTVNALANTVFTDDTDISLAGLIQARMELGGYFQAGSGLIDECVSGKLAVADTLVTLCPNDASVGDRCYAMRGVEGEVTNGGAVGEQHDLSFSLSCSSATGGLLFGNVMVNETHSANDAADALELGAVGEGEYLYAGLHIPSVTAGDSITLKIESSPTYDPWEPTDRLLFDEASAAGAQFGTPVAGPITDTFWRAIWTVTGTDPSFDIFAWMAIK